MITDYVILPKPLDVKVARIYLDWSQKDLAKKCGVNTYAITTLETGKHNTTKQNLEKIATVFLGEGIKFLPNGGFSVEKEVIKIFEGQNGYIKILEDALQTCSTLKKELLILGNDDRRSSNEANEIHKKLYAASVPYKLLIAKDNDYILGPIENYRKVDEDSFFSKDAVLIYDDKIIFAVRRESAIKNYELVNMKLISIYDREMAETFRKYFYRLWERGEAPKKSSTKQIFFKTLKLQY